MAILVTGGAGFIGSHTCVELLNAGYEVVVLDNLVNASEKSLERVKAITGKDVTFYKGDILDREILNEIFKKEKIDSCIHFAGLKAVGESVQKPWEYYNNNISGTLTLVDVMRQHNCKNIIFSSSATVYGDPAFVPITEECPKGFFRYLLIFLLLLISQPAHLHLPALRLYLLPLHSQEPVGKYVNPL